MGRALEGVSEPHSADDDAIEGQYQALHWFYIYNAISGMLHTLPHRQSVR
jgi:hypothetical protein